MKKDKPRWKNLDMYERLARRCKRSGCSEETVEHLRGLSRKKGSVMSDETSVKAGENNQGRCRNVSVLFVRKENTK